MDPIVTVLLIVGFTVVMFIWEKVPIDVTSHRHGPADPQWLGHHERGISGFSNEAVITILFLYLLGAGLENRCCQCHRAAVHAAFCRQRKTPRVAGHHGGKRFC